MAVQYAAVTRAIYGMKYPHNIQLLNLSTIYIVLPLVHVGKMVSIFYPPEFRPIKIKNIVIRVIRFIIYDQMYLLLFASL